MPRYATLMRFDLTIDTPWAIGAFTRSGSTGDDAVQAPIQRRPDGSVYLPATSLVGGLRDHLGEAASHYLGVEKGGETSPSRLRVLGANVVEAKAPEEVTGVAIDGHRRAAKGGHLFTREVIPGGTRVQWWLLWDRDDAETATLSAFLDLAATWRPVVGRRRTSNQGWGTLHAIHHRTIDRRDPAGLTWWLQERRACLAPDADLTGWETRQGESPSPKPSIEYRFEAIDPLHIGDGKPPQGADPDKDNVLYTKTEMPADSWRGIFRHRVAHILRVTGREVKGIDERLFGSARTEGESLDGGTRGILRFESSPVQLPDGTTPEPKGLPCLTQVAIDRISGGSLMNSQMTAEASHGSLYSVQYLPPGSTLSLRIHELQPLPQTEGHRQWLTGSRAPSRHARKGSSPPTPGPITPAGMSRPNRPNTSSRPATSGPGAETTGRRGGRRPTGAPACGCAAPTSRPATTGSRPPSMCSARLGREPCRRCTATSGSSAATMAPRTGTVCRRTSCG